MIALWKSTLCVALLLEILQCGSSLALETPDATFALIIGVNRSVDKDLPLLRYADDDAAMYFNLFRALGAKTFLLVQVDRATRMLQAQASAEARTPTKENLLEVISVLKGEIARAHTRGIRTTFYFIYSGHGNAKGGQGYITLHDERLTGDDIETLVIKPLDADTSHVIVDACFSIYLTSTKGPGGHRRPVAGFSRQGSLVADKRVGLLLSTTAGQKSFEWEGFQAGVFSHEVRSGLYGAADVDGNGWVDYREIAAFVERANGAIPNERLRPKVFARPPAGSENLLDIRQVLKRRLDISGKKSAHYFIEDARGIRVADFHNAVGQSLSLFRPLNMGKLYLASVDEGTEFSIPRLKPVVAMSDLHQSATMVTQRGPLEESLRSLFSLPFSAKDVKKYSFPPVPEVGVFENAYSTANWKDTVGWSMVGISGASLVSGLVSSVIALGYRNSVTNKSSQRDISEINHSIEQANTGAKISYAVAAVGGLLGLVFLLWPDSGMSFGSGDSGVEMEWRF